MASERLHKIIARAGFASRRGAEEMIREGRVTVNGKSVTELGSRADPDADHIKVDGKLITRSESPRYILLYKPKEVMTTVDDPEGRRTVLDFIRGVKERIFPVGRLDFQSEGLILLTNDGELAYRVSHPTFGSVKTYNVKVRGVPEDRIIEKLTRGILIDGKRTLPCEIDRLRTTGRATGRSDDEGNSWFEVRLREGRTQQIRKMFKAVGHPVSKLKRVAIGGISDSSLQPGEWRELTKREIKLLEKPEPAQKKPARKPRKASTKTAPGAAKKTQKPRGRAAGSGEKTRGRTTRSGSTERSSSTRRAARGR